MNMYIMIIAFVIIILIAAAIYIGTIETKNIDDNSVPEDEKVDQQPLETVNTEPFLNLKNKSGICFSADSESNIIKGAECNLDDLNQKWKIIGEKLQNENGKCVSWNRYNDRIQTTPDCNKSQKWSFTPDNQLKNEKSGFCATPSKNGIYAKECENTDEFKWEFSK